MSALSAITEQVRDKIHSGVDRAKKRLFGANNENLDFFIDSFNKFDARRKMIAVACLVVLIFGIFFGVFAIYFSSIGSLKSELGDGLSSLRELQANIGEYEVEVARFNSLTSSLSASISGFAARPFFEGLAKRLSVKIDNMDEKRLEFDSVDPMSQKNFKKVLVEMRIRKISIPRLLEFLKESEKSNKFLKLQNLQVTEIFNEKRLYFSVNLKIRGYVRG